MNAQQEINRRKFLESTGILAVGLCLVPKLVFSGTKLQTPNLLKLLAQESPVLTIMRAAATAEIVPTKLRGNITVLDGSGGNIAVLYGPQGKLLVDAGIGVSQKNVSAALSNIGPLPLKYLINTHWHFDHADGNLWLHQQGATIIAQENTKKHLEVETRVEDWDYTFPPAPKEALPTINFKHKHSIKFNGETLELEYYKPAHTDSDISVYFRKADVLHVADTFWNGYYPFIDYSTGGNINGMIMATERNIKRTTDKTIIIPGHGPVANRKQLIEYRDMLVTVRDTVKGLKNQGKSLDQVIALKPTAAFDQKWGAFVINGATFTMLVYKGL